MKLRRAALLAILSALTALGAVGAASASAAPAWDLSISHNETNFPPGGNAEYWFRIKNVGDTETSGPITLTVNLPSGLTGTSVSSNMDVTGFNGTTWSCPDVAGASTVVCTSSDSVARHRFTVGPILTVDVDSSASGALTTTASVAGGGAETVADAETTPISSEPASFGIFPGSFQADFFRPDSLTPVRQSGAHPELATFAFDFNTVHRPGADPVHKSPVENIRNLKVNLPPGFLGDPTAVPECSAAEFSSGTCPDSTQVGVIDIVLTPLSSDIHLGGSSASVFNLAHPRGSVSDLAFDFAAQPVHINASLDPTERYAVTTSVPSINESLPPFNQKLTVWGIPADPSHDSERCGFADTSVDCPSTAPRKAFLTVPFECGVDHQMRLHHYDSWENTGVFGPDVTYTMPGQTTDCDKPVFEPSVEINPTGRQANTPTGLDVSIQVPQVDNANAPATPPVKRTVVTLPEGMTVSPSFADGLDGCTPAQIGLFTNNPVKCPDNSRIGEVSLATPLLPKPVVGSMYLAKQGDNPFQSTFAMYMAVEDTEERGALVKIPGRIDLHPVTGQITTTFDDLPQFPFEDFTLSFRSGQRAPLINPPSCGTHKIEIEVASYTQPTKPVDASNTYEVSEGPGGGPCPPSAASRPFAPRMSAGTLNPTAGSYSPFVFRLDRTDADQEISSVTATLPPGLVAKIAGIPFCPEAAINSISTAEGTGASESASPSCPLASQVGTVNTGVGAGTGPNYFLGKAFLAGPYKGAPLSLAIVVPALAGPYDLGSVLVRTAINVDPETAQVTATSDPFPAIVHGVLLRVRDIRLKMDRPDTTINPTSCAPMSVDGLIGGVGGSLFTAADDLFVNRSTPFQVGECASLSFKPTLSFRLFGGTQRGAHPRLKAVVRMPAGGANIAKASVALPRSEFLDQSHIGTVCTRVQFKADNCPAASVYGKAEVKTPLLDEALRGPIYLRSSDNLLPDLVVAFRGGRVDFNLVGRIDSIRGGIRNTFDLVPDAPVTWAAFDFLGGKKGLLINSRNLCKKTYRATAKFKAHNGRAITLHPPMRNSCSKASRKGKGR